MGAPVPEMEATESASAEALLSSLRTIAAKERRKHASVFNYWLSIRGNRPFPPIRDLDPLEISDAGPFSVLLEMIGGGENAEIRHLGQAIKAGVEVDRISEAPKPSLLSCIHAKLPIVAACREAFAFEDEFATDDGTRRCWVTLLPFSATGTWIDFVYGFVSLDGESAAGEEDPASGEPELIEEALESAEAASEPFTVPLRPFDEEPEPAGAIAEPAEVIAEALEELPEPEAEAEPVPEPIEEAQGPVETASEPFTVPLRPLDEEPEPAAAMAEPVEVTPEALEELPEAESGSSHAPGREPEATKPGFSARLFEGLASVGGFYGKVTQAEPSSHAPECSDHAGTVAPTEDVPADELAQPTCEMEGHLQSKLSEVRAKAEEARMAQMRSITALHEGLSAAYDFALDAEQEPEQYLRLVEAQGLKIQLRSPMQPVVKLGFDGMCDEATIAQLEAVLAWALKMDLPRGALAERLEAEGGIGPILNGQASA